MKKILCCLLVFVCLLGAVSCKPYKTANPSESSGEESIFDTQSPDVTGVEQNGMVVLKYDDRYSFGEEIEEICIFPIEPPGMSSLLEPARRRWFSKAVERFGLRFSPQVCGCCFCSGKAMRKE